MFSVVAEPGGGRVILALAHDRFVQLFVRGRDAISFLVNVAHWRWLPSFCAFDVSIFCCYWRIVIFRGFARTFHMSLVLHISSC